MLSCAILMKLQNIFLLCDTCCLSQCISTISFPVLIVVMYLLCFVFEVHKCTIRENWAFGHAFKQRSYWYVLWLHLGIMLYSLVSIFMCTCFFSDKYLCDVVYLETYTHKKWYISSWYLNSLVSTFLLLFDYLVAPGKNLPMSACFI